MAVQLDTGPLDFESVLVVEVHVRVGHGMKLGFVAGTAAKGKGDTVDVVDSSVPLGYHYNAVQVMSSLVGGCIFLAYANLFDWQVGENGHCRCFGGDADTVHSGRPVEMALNRRTEDGVDAFADHSALA